MKKYIALIIIVILTITSCEQDSICIDATTPNLVIRFYDFDNPSETKKVEGLTVWANGKDSLYINISLDSIAIPLNLNENFILYKLSASTLTDDINFTYSKSDVFVGRSCGYKTIYEDFQIESTTNNWIKNIEIINTIIDNDTAAQIHIFH